MAKAHDHTSGSFATASEMKRWPLSVCAPVSPWAEHGTDPLSHVLRMVKLTGALFFMVDARGGWGVQVPQVDDYAAVLLPGAQHLISYHIILKGRGWAGIPGGPSTPFEAGDILVLPHGDPYAMLSAPDQPLEFDSAATLGFFREMAAGRLPFVIREGDGGAEKTEFICGYLGCDVRPYNPALIALPPLLRIRRPADGHDDLLDRLVDLTLAEARAASRVGADSIRLRLSELMFVEVVRRYLESLPPGQSGWLAGLRDPAVGRVLALLHDRPAEPWTLHSLAEAAGMSRAVLAERFAALVGCPPIQYLTRWRMQIAARMLADGAAKVAAVGYAVGYESEAAFSRAFKKIAGVPPAQWRAERA